MEEKILIRTEKTTSAKICATALTCAIIAFAILALPAIATTPAEYLVESVILPGLLLAVIAFILILTIGALLNQSELTVTDKRAYGKAAFGRRVDLPLDSISSVGTGIFKCLSVATSSGRITFWFIQNLDEFHDVLAKLLIERQSKPEKPVEIKHEIPQSNADELKKYKDLLDSGIITQEEFDAKKKQLLGL